MSCHTFKATLTKSGLCAWELLVINQRRELLSVLQGMNFLPSFKFYTMSGIHQLATVQEAIMVQCVGQLCGSPSTWELGYGRCHLWDSLCGGLAVMESPVWGSCSEVDLRCGRTVLWGGCSVEDLRFWGVAVWAVAVLGSCSVGCTTSSWRRLMPGQ